jgi:hypothetical protein
LKEGVFMEMMKFDGKPKSDGVEQIWELVDKIV